MRVKTDSICNIDGTNRTTWIVLFEDDGDYDRSQSQPRDADSTDLKIRRKLGCTRYGFDDLDRIDDLDE